MLEELVKQALVGTARAAPAGAPVARPLGEAIQSLPTVSPEATLLQTAVLCGAYERCGRKPNTISLQPERSPADRLGECSARASQILDLVLGSSDTSFNQQLVREWFGYAASARRRVPHRLLPRVLDFAIGHRALRDSITPAIDARGEWLMNLNPRWQFSVAADADLDSLWRTGNKDQRLSAIRQIRQSEPARGRGLIESTWQEDLADDRAAFIEALSVGLGPADETLLEAALDDKSKRVRTAAAELLTTLPQSAFVRRMTERAILLLRFVPAESGRLLKLKRARPATIEVSLPPELFDKTLVRDGIVEKPAETMGIRQWWLLQIISYVPPATWAARWNLTPTQCIEAVGEFGDILLRAWLLAAKRCADPAWLRALALAAIAEGIDKFDHTLLALLAPSDQLEVVTRIVESPRAEIEMLGQVLGASHCELDKQCTMATIDKIEYHLSSSAAVYQYHLALLLQNMVLRVPPQMHDELATRWGNEKWESNRKSLDEFFQVLILRRDMKREFLK